MDDGTIVCPIGCRHRSHAIRLLRRLPVRPAGIGRDARLRDLLVGRDVRLRDLWLYISFHSPEKFLKMQPHFLSTLSEVTLVYGQNQRKSFPGDNFIRHQDIQV